MVTMDVRVGIEIIRKRLDAYEAASNEGQLPLDYRMTAVEMLAAQGRALKFLDDIQRNVVDDERFLLEVIDKAMGMATAVDQLCQRARVGMLAPIDREPYASGQTPAAVCNPPESIYCGRSDCPTCHGWIERRSFINRLKAEQQNDNGEGAHINADAILCDLLNALGFSDVVAEYHKIGKWYA